jgi:hypothetical protein
MQQLLQKKNNNYYLFWVCVCSLSYLTGDARALYCRLWPAPNVTTYLHLGVFVLLWRCDPTRFMASSFLRFLDHTQQRTTVGRTSLDEWSARRRDLYLTTHNTHNRQISMPPVGFEPTISAGERPQTYAPPSSAEVNLWSYASTHVVVFSN